MVSETIRHQLIGLGVGVETIAPWAGHQPNPHATLFVINFLENSAPPEVMDILRQIETPNDFAYTVNVQEVDGPRRVASDAGTAEPMGRVAANPARAIELGIASVLSSWRSSEGWYQAIEWEERGIEMTIENQAKLGEEINATINLIVQSVSVECFPTAWKFAA